MADQITPKIERYIDGLVQEIFRADQSFSALKAIDGFVPGINARNHSELFNFCQGLLGDRISLALTKLFEEAKRNRIHSISSLLDVLERNRNSLVLTQRINVVRRLKDLGYKPAFLNSQSDSEIISLIIEHFRGALPSHDAPLGGRLSTALSSLKTLRDKRISHREATSAAMPKIPLDFMEELLDVAKHFVGLVGWAFLSRGYDSDSRAFILSSDAARIGASLSRLLKAADLDLNAGCT